MNIELTQKDLERLVNKVRKSLVVNDEVEEKILELILCNGGSECRFCDNYNICETVKNLIKEV